MANYIFVGEVRFQGWALARDYLEHLSGIKISVKALRAAVEQREKVNGVYVGTVPPPERVVPLQSVERIHKRGTPLLRDYQPLTFGIPKFHLA